MLMLIVIAAGGAGTALADSDEANAVAGTVTAAQVLAVAASVAGKTSATADADVPSVAHLQHVLGLNADVLQALLRNLARTAVKPDQAIHALTGSIRQVGTVTEQLSAISLRDPDGMALVTQAKAAMPAGDFARVAALLQRLEQRELAAAVQLPSGTADGMSDTDDHPMRAAQLRGVLGELALMELRYGEAAEDFQEAAVFLPPGHLDDRLRFLMRRGDALVERGKTAGDSPDLEAAVAIFRDILSQRPRQSAPREWATAQYKLGLALDALGEHETGTTSLAAAVTAYRAALDADERGERPSEWAAIQCSLGDTLVQLGSREGDAARLEEAVRAYRAALQVPTRQRAPLEWAATQNKLGLTLAALGERGGVTAYLREATAAFTAALEERTPARVPYDWAATQRNLADALSTIGQAEDGTQALEEAIIAYRAALDVIPRHDTASQWGVTQFNLANALFILGGRTDDRGRLVEALDSFQQAKTAFESAKLSNLAVSVAPMIALVQQRLAVLASADSNWAESPPTNASTSLVLAEHKREGESLGVAVTSANPAEAAPDADPAAPAASQDPITTVVVMGKMATKEAEPSSSVIRQKQTEPASPAASSRRRFVTRTLQADMMALLLSRGDTLLALGDVSAARLLYERAASGGNARAATGAGKTRDPRFLAEIGARGIPPDAEAAADWYRRAMELGDQSAADLLKRMSQRADR